MTPEDIVKRLRHRREESWAAVMEVAADLIERQAKALEEAEKALEGLSNFAWSAVTADCDASRDYLNSLVADARNVLTAIRNAR